MIANPGTLRHYVDVIGPDGVETDRGQVQGDRTLMRNVPCSIEVLSGREAEIANQRLPQASTRITMRGPIPGLSAGCVLVEKPHSRKHHVGFVEDPTRIGREYRCLCTEEVA